MGLVSLLFSFKGRINRVQFWGATIASYVVFVVALFAVGISAVFATVSAGGGARSLGALASTFLFAAPVVLAYFWSSYALQVKRLHDRGRSGNLLLVPMIPSFMAMLGVVHGVMSGESDPNVLTNAGQPWVSITWLLYLALFVDMGLLPSKPGPNKFGDPPGGARAEPETPVAPASEAAATLFGAQAAIDRAIADTSRMLPPKASTPLPHAPTLTPAPTTAPSFGRRVR